MTRFNYEEKGQVVWLIKPATDTRDDIVNEEGIKETTIKSRIGLSAQAEAVDTTTNIKELFENIIKVRKVDVVIADEAQFFTEEQIIQLREIVSRHDVPVLCFGLRTDFRCKLFPGSKALFEVADSISEIKSICKCGNKAIVNARLDENGIPVINGPQVELGGNERYEGMCWSCWAMKIDD